MRRLAYFLILPYIVVAYGFIIPLSDVDEALGSLSRVAGIPAGIAWVCAMMGGGSIRRPNAYIWALFAFFGFSALSMMWTVDQPTTMFVIQRHAVFAAGSFLIWDLIRTKEQLRSALQAVVITGWAISLTLFSNASANETVLAGRVSALGLHPNMVPRLLGMAFPIAWCLALEVPYRRAWMNVLNLLFPFFGSVAMLTTGSRGGLVACLPAYIYLIVSLPRLKSSQLTTMGIFGAGGAMFALTRLNIAYQLQRIGTLFGGAATADDAGAGDLSNGRLAIWEAGLRRFVDNWAIGVGAGGFPETTRYYALDRKDSGQPLVAHNTYLSVLVETGVVGFTLFLTLIGTVLAGLLRMPPGWKAAMVATFSVLVFGIVTGSWDHQVHFYLIFTLLATTAAVLREEADEEVTPLEEEEELPAIPPTWEAVTR